MKERNRFGLTQRDMATIENILKKHFTITHVCIFGSRAKGNYKFGSDIDLVIMDENISEKEMSTIKSEFEDSNLPYTVDILDYHHLDNLDPKDHIDRVGLNFYKIQIET